MEYTPFALLRMWRLGIHPQTVMHVVDQAVVVIPLHGGKVLYEGLAGGLVVSVIVHQRPPRTVVGVATRRL